MSETRVPAIPSPTDQNLREVARAVKGVLDVREGLIGDPLDANVTFRDLQDGGVISVTTVRRGGAASSVIVSPGTGSADSGYDPTTDLTPPPAPTGFTATGAFASILLSWNAPNYPNHAYTEIWRASPTFTGSPPNQTEVAPVIGNAVMIGTTEANLYADYIGNSGVRYYWVRFRSQADVAGPYNATNGARAETSPDPGLLLDLLTGEITESQLYQDLGARINLIDDPTTGLVKKVGDLQTTYGSTASAATSAAAAAQSASDAVAAKTAAILAQSGAEGASAASAQSASDAVAAKTAAISAQSGAVTAKDAAVVAKTAAETAQANAATSAQQASSSATGALGSASSASQSATTAANSATAAGNSASAASTSATNAQTYATNAETASTASNTAKVAAEAARDAASGSASSAATSAQTATAKATEAGQSATSASTSATTATTKASEASTSASQASTSASNAAGSASSASQSATTAANSATAAGNSASAAATSASNANTYATTAETASTAATSARVAAEASFGGSVRLNGNYDFSQGKTGWSQSTGSYVETDGTILSGPTNSVTGGKSIRLYGERWVYWDRRIPVQLARKYRVRFRVRNLGGSPSIIYAGVATFDASGSLETSSPGTHRYCAVSGLSAPADNGWYVYEGVITGGGNSSMNEFRTTTAFASPMFIVNYTQGSGGICDVDECSFEDITESANAASSASAAATSASTATAKATEAAQSASSATTSANTAATKAAEAATSATSAATSETNAAGSSSSASTSATNAANSANAAGGSATAAAGSASTASTQATNAGNSASAANTAKVAAESARDAAQGSASAAATSASTAATKATEAGQSASAASSSATQAATSESNALTYRNEASSSASTATTKASEASTSAGAAATSATNASNSASAASTSANTASTKATEASQSASAASTSATTASTQASQAGVYATNAATSATNAAGSATSAASALTQIQASNATALAAVQTLATTVAGPDGATAQYTVKTDTNGYVAGFGLSSTSNAAGTGTSSFAVRADQFYIANPSGPSVSPAMPFIVRTTPTTINGVSVPAGVYITDAFIQNGTITTAKIGFAAIDRTKIGDGEITTAKIGDAQITNAKISGTIQSDNYSAGSAGWAISKSNGFAEFGAASIRGQLTASQINGANLKITAGDVQLGNDVVSAGHYGLSLSGSNYNNIFLRRSDGVVFFRINEGGTNSLTFDSASGQLKIKGEINGGAFTGFAWPASGTGFHLGPNGLLLGNANTGSYFQVNQNGDIYAPGLTILGGTATFSGTISANVVKTASIEGAAVTSGYASSGTGTWTGLTIVVPAGASAIMVQAYVGDPYQYTVGNGKEAYNTTALPIGTLYVNGSAVTTQQGTVIWSTGSPTVGTYNVELTRDVASGTARLAVLVAKR